MDELIGKVVEGKVIRLTEFGAFIWLSCGKKGLIHISQISNSFVKDVSEYLNVNDTVKARVISKNKNGDLNLSIKDVDNEDPVNTRQTKYDGGFEKKLALFLKESGEILSDLKKNIEAKRGEKRKR
ncbi:TPA: RNA-binding protein S1 [bacterium]|nr:RNA-binding protein S1 [bacterium]